MNQIRVFRERQRLSQGQLAELAGLSLDTISRYETNKRSPRVVDLEKIAKALNCTAKDLLSNPPEPSSQQTEEPRANRKTA